jgi:hypothetical protein
MEEQLKTIITCFAGRKEYMEIQIRYVLKLLNKFSFIENYDIWNFSWSESDSDYLNTLPSLHPKIRIRNAPYYGKAERAGEVGSKQYAYFFNQGYAADLYKKHIFVKIDDDVLHIDIDNFELFVEERKLRSDCFLVSANVINNNFNIIDPSLIHEDFFNKNENPYISEKETVSSVYSNSLRLSINFCSWLGSDLPDIIQEFSNGVGSNDEWRLCNIIPNKVNKNNLIVNSYKVSHFSFGTQAFNKPYYLNKYKKLSNML